MSIKKTKDIYLTNNVTKQYIIPTIEWLKPNEELITEDISTEGFLIIADLIKKEKVIVKITKGYNKKVKYFNNLFKNEKYNLIKTYCNFYCHENDKTLTSKYKDKNEFCSGNNEQQLILLEIMKKYEGSLTLLEGKLNSYTYLEILKQLLLTQIYLFEKYGFIHNDLHSGNILYKTYSTNEDISYNVLDNVIIVNSIVEIIFSDFSYAISYDENVFNNFDSNFLFDKTINKPNKINFHKELTLLNNIVAVVNNSLNLLNFNDKKYNFIKNKIDEFLNSDYIKEKLTLSRKNLANLFNKHNTYKTFKEREVNMNVILTNYLFKLIYSHDYELIPYFNT